MGRAPRNAGRAGQAVAEAGAGGKGTAERDEMRIGAIRRPPAAPRERRIFNGISQLLVSPGPVLYR